MPEYTSKQVAAWAFVIAGLVGAVGLALLATFAPAGRPEAIVGVVMLGVALLVANFAVLRVRVSDADVSWSFARFIGRRVPLADIRGAEVRHSPWYWGWGIRWTPRGWLWRSHGLDVVWLQLTNGKEIGIGSSDPKRLAHAIRERLEAAD